MSSITRITTPFSYAAAVVAGDYATLGLHRGFGDGFAAQLTSAMEALTSTLAELNLTRDALIKVHVWLKHIADLLEMEKLFFDYFPDGQFPARMTSTTEFIDDDCLVMLEGVAYCGK